MTTQPRDSKGRFVKIDCQQQEFHAYGNKVVAKYPHLKPKPNMDMEYLRSENGCLRAFMNGYKDQIERQKLTRLHAIVIWSTLSFIAGTIFFLILNQLIKK